MFDILISGPNTAATATAQTELIRIDVSCQLVEVLSIYK